MRRRSRRVAKPHDTMGAFFSSFGGETTTPPPKAKAAAKSKKVAKKATVQKKPAAKAKSPAKAKPAAKAKSPRQQDEDAPPPAAGAESARLEFVGANAANESGESSKFWQMTLSGAHTYVVNGRIGTEGTLQKPVFHGDAAAARKFFDKTVKSKLKKGYQPA